MRRASTNAFLVLAFVALLAATFLRQSQAFGGFGNRSKKKQKKADAAAAGNADDDDDGLAALGPNAVYARADALYAENEFERSAQAYWAALMKVGQADASGTAAYTVEQAFAGVLRSYQARGAVDDGYLFIADQYAGRKQMTEAMLYYEQALSVNPNNTRVHLRLAELTPEPHSDTGRKRKLEHLAKAFEVAPRDAGVNFALGNFLFELKQWTASIEHLQAAYFLNPQLTEAASSVIYLRSSMCMWGKVRDLSMVPVMTG
jgi:tetratricopeptide (TPR) repeat protein